MALREIGAKLTLDGEAEWKSQMNAVNRELKTVKSELAANSAEFAGCANSAEALRSKQALLQTQYAQQKEKVRALTQALQDMEEAGQGNTKKADDLRVSLNYAKVAASKTSTEIDDLAGYLEEAESSADGCATSIDGFGNKVKSAGDNAGDAGDKSGTLKEALSELVPGFDKVSGVLSGTGGTVALLGGVGAALGAAFNWAMNLVEETEELRTSLAKLNATAETLGVSVGEDLNENLVDLYTIADGDWDSAFEALQNLLNAGYDETLPEIINLLAGAVESFPDTMKIESLADSLQETLATGEATGQFAELLDRMGVSTDEFNSSLKQCTTEMQKQKLAASTLADQGLGKVADEYNTANKESLALSESQAELELANAKLAESFVPLKTWINNVGADLAGFGANLMEAYTHGGTGIRAWLTGIASGIAAGDEAGVTMEELYDLMDEGGYKFKDLAQNAADAGMGLGEYVNSLRDTEEASEDVTDATDDMTASTYDASIAMEEQAANVETAMDALDELEALYEGLRSAVDSAVSGFNDMTDATADYETTAADMIAALQSQIDYMADYKANLLAAADMGLSDALIAELSDGSAQSAAYLQAIVDGGAEKIAELNDTFGEVEEGKTDLVDTFAELSPEVQDKLAEVTDVMDDAVTDWDKNAEANTSGRNTVTGLVNGVSSKIPTLIAKGRAAGNAFLDAYNAAANGTSTGTSGSSGSSGKVSSVSVSSSVKSHKTGLDYVPYDGYLASLHYGERVLTAEENRAYSNNYATNLGGVAITVNAAQGQSTEEIARAVSKELWREAERNNAVYGRSYL